MRCSQNRDPLKPPEKGRRKKTERHTHVLLGQPTCLPVAHGSVFFHTEVSEAWLPAARIWRAACGTAERMPARCPGRSPFAKKNTSADSEEPLVNQVVLDVADVAFKESNYPQTCYVATKRGSFQLPVEPAKPVGGSFNK